MKSHLLPGYIDLTGQVKAHPVTVELSDDGKVLSHCLLTGFEPPFTTPLPALLRLSDLALLPLK